MELYSHPKTGAGLLIPCLPRNPIQCIWQTKKRRDFSYALYLETTKTHHFLDTYPALCYNYTMPARGSKYPDPPAPDALVDFTLSYFPDWVSELYDRECIYVDVLRTSSMFVNISMKCANGDADFGSTALSDINGTYFSNEGHIILREGTFPFMRRDGEIFWENVEDVMGHELGHVIDCSCEWISERSPSFRKAYLKERTMFDSYIASTQIEYFATASWVCNRFPILANKFIPETYRWMEEFFN